jgi:hypothetical protein
MNNHQKRCRFTAPRLSRVHSCTCVHRSLIEAGILSSGACTDLASAYSSTCTDMASNSVSSSSLAALRASWAASATNWRRRAAMRWSMAVSDYGEVSVSGSSKSVAAPEDPLLWCLLGGCYILLLLPRHRANDGVRRENTLVFSTARCSSPVS